MGRFDTILSPGQIPRLLVAAAAAGGVWIILYAFLHYGMVAGAAIAMAPIALCAIWFSLRNPAVAMFGMLIINYFIMGLGRYLRDKPTGTILDALIFYNIFLMILHAMFHHVEWGRARTGLTLASGIWLIYCTLEILNPEAVSISGWFSSYRSVAMYFFLTVVLTQIQLSEFKYLKYMLIIWSVLTLLAVAKAYYQKTFGFSETEKYWLYVLGGARTHIIYSGTRYFSFFSDAANFGGAMGMSMVVFAISSLYFRSRWMKGYLLLVAMLACYGMLISGTRSALAVPFAGFAVFIVLAGNAKTMIIGAALVVGAFIFLNFTTIGQGNTTIRRARSAFNTNDPSFQLRLDNQAKLREIMADKPFGGGLGHGGGKAKAFAPDAPLSNVATDSWFVMIWVETGVVGILLHVGVLLYILGWGAYQVFFRLRNIQVRGLTAALIAGISGIVVMSYANEVLGQIPTGLIIYMSAAFIFMAPRFDQEMTASETPKTTETTKPAAI